MWKSSSWPSTCRLNGLTSSATLTVTLTKPPTGHSFRPSFRRSTRNAFSPRPRSRSRRSNDREGEAPAEPTAVVRHSAGASPSRHETNMSQPDEPDDDRPWTEAQWEALMKRSDVRSAKFGELLETFM